MTRRGDAGQFAFGLVAGAGLVLHSPVANAQPGADAGQKIAHGIFTIWAECDSAISRLKRGAASVGVEVSIDGVHNRANSAYQSCQASYDRLGEVASSDDAGIRRGVRATILHCQGSILLQQGIALKYLRAYNGDDLPAKITPSDKESHRDDLPTRLCDAGLADLVSGAPE